MLSAKEFSLRDKFGTYNGMEVVSVEKGRARAQMVIGPNHLNGLGTIQGGAIFTLADLAFAAAANAGDEMAVSIQASISFSKACSKGVLSAEAVEVARSSRLVTYDVRVKDATGSIIAVFQGVGYIKKS